MTGGSGPRNRAALVTVLGGSLLVLLDTSIANVALPAIAADLNSDVGIEWVVTSHLLALGIAQAPSGWLADRFGLRPVFLSSLVGFGALSSLAAAAPNVETLIAARAGQGLCGGAALVVATNLMYELAAPGSEGSVVGASGAMAMLAPAFGPPLSGWVIEVGDWRWIFAGFAPACAVAVLFGMRFIADPAPARRRRADPVGMLLLSAALVVLLLAFTRASSWGLGSARFLLLVGIGLAVLAAFVRWSARRADPLIDLELYRSRDFSICMGVVAAMAMAQFARNVFIPIEMQSIHGLSPAKAGALLTPGALLGAVTMPLAGRWSDRIGVKIPMILGLTMTAASMALLATIDPDTPVWLIVAYVSVSGAGTVLVALPVTVMSLSAVRARLRSQASAVRNLTRQVAGALGTAVLATVIVSETGALTEAGTDPAALDAAQDAFNRGFLVATALLVVGLVLAMGLRRAPLAPQEDK